MPPNRNRGSRDNFRSGQRDRNSSMDGKSQDDSRENTGGGYGNDTRKSRSKYMPPRNRQHNRDVSRQIYVQRYDSRKRRLEQQNRSVRIELPRNDGEQNHQNIIFNSRNAQNRAQSHKKPDNMILVLILDNEATIIQPGPKTRHANTARELITHLENLKLVLIA